jgi:hypothetical protein
MKKGGGPSSTNKIRPSLNMCARYSSKVGMSSTIKHEKVCKVIDPYKHVPNHPSGVPTHEERGVTSPFKPQSDVKCVYASTYVPSRVKQGSTPHVMVVHIIKN